MRPSTIVRSGMPTGKTWSGWWGDMKGPKQKGIYTYSVSPFAQRPFAGALNGYVFWGFRRIAQQVPYFIVPFATGYAVYLWGYNKYAYYNSKEGHHAIHEAEHGGH
ncbi:Cytochrome b-c1 complex subunit 8, mitochondrial [Vanrija albida]|uniref:Cytochrome b-c1 complex subunit 8 n=1 Tax=Vanrija albida TaxID=181172 RepID=A0ABR3QCI8_9TREE